MELITTTLIERIRKALIKRYDRDQQIQQMIEEIGTEEGLNETELAIVYQAYLEVKERVYYTSTLVDLWNQIDEVQNRMSLLHTYESLEQDLFGDVVGHVYDDGTVDHGIGKGVDNHHDAYAMEEVQLEDVPLQHDTTVGVNHIKLNELHAMSGLFTGAGESIEKNADMDDLDEAPIEHMHAEPLQGVELLETKHVHDSVDAFKEKQSSTSERKNDDDEDIDLSEEDDIYDVEDNIYDAEDDMDESDDEEKDLRKIDSEDESDDDVSIDPFTAVNALLFGKSDMDRNKGQKKLEKLIKKQLKRVDKEWARINGTDGKSKKSKDKKEKDKKAKKGKDKKDKKNKKDKKDKLKKDKDKKDKKSKDDKAKSDYKSLGLSDKKIDFSGKKSKKDGKGGKK